MTDTFKDLNGVLLQGHIKISDPESGEILIDKRNAIHYENMSEALALSVANKTTGFVHEMAFGNGGTSVDPTGVITYLTPNSTGTNATLYNQTYYKVIERLLPKYNRYYNNNNKILEENCILELYSEDGIFSIKVVYYNYKINSANQLIKTEGIINGDTINVYKTNKNSEKEVYTKMEFNYNPKKHEKSLKRLLKKLNSF